MGPRVGDLEPRQLERWRGQIVEAMGAHLAYPPFYDYRSGREVVRPLDRAKRDELDQFVRSANFSPLEASDPTSPEVRRFLERLLLRYIDVNPATRGVALARRGVALRARVPKIAADIHRAFLGNPAQPASAAPSSWRPARRVGVGGNGEVAERNTRVLEAILTRGEAESGTVAAVVGGPRYRESREARPGYGGAPGTTDGWARPTDATIPVPARGMPQGDGSPFAAFGAGAQSDVFAAMQSVSDRPTGPLSPGPGASSPALPEDLYQLYGDYLRDMHPEADTTVAHAAVMAAAPAASGGPVLPRRAGTDELAPHPTRAARQAAAAPGGPDVQIFYQLRYQLDAYVRRAARGYGVRARGDDAFSHLDALRRSGFVDEADLRLAEGILAVTDKVIETGLASVEDFRQAMMLYLLYHRSHLGG